MFHQPASGALAAQSGPSCLGVPASAPVDQGGFYNYVLFHILLPIANPASHFWTSSDPSIASVNPDTGEVHVQRPGSVTITCTTDMQSGSITLTATR